MNAVHRVVTIAERVCTVRGINVRLRKIPITVNMATVQGDSWHA
ncbi:hypothetical protein DESC_350044 [Desulfosarcina cetonica]|nr:hypothetical protein DESC_350044 [Desulfosarcina cetonica]